jgi:hypothetical protein
VIYVMSERDESGAATQYVKIGFVSSDEPGEAMRLIRERLIKLQSGNPRKLSVIAMMEGGRTDEKCAHRMFHEHRVKRPTASEWIRLSPALESWIEPIRLVAPIEVSTRVGLGAKGGTSHLKLGTNRCSQCKSVAHTKARCPEVPERKPRSQPKPIRMDDPKWKGRTWVWRGKVRPLRDAI